MGHISPAQRDVALEPPLWPKLRDDPLVTLLQPLRTA